MSILDNGIMARIRGTHRGEMPFLDHLEELRVRLFWSIASLAVGCGVGFWLIRRFNVVELLKAPMGDILGEDWTLIYLGVTDAFFMLVRLVVTAGFLLASPIIVYQIWAFLSPALEKHEKRTIIPALYLGLVLFAMGVAMAYFIALPVSLQFLLGIMPEFMTPQLEATRYYAFVLKLLLGFGVVFELPVVIMILSALGLVTPRFLRSKRKHAVVVNLVVASLLSPGDVVMITVLMMVPLVLLYEFSILLSAMIYRKREKRENAIADPNPPEGSEPTAAAAPVVVEAPEGSEASSGKEADHDGEADAGSDDSGTSDDPGISEEPDTTDADDESGDKD